MVHLSTNARIRTKFHGRILWHILHRRLKARLIEISTALLQHKGKSTAYEILGTIDAIKVRSSMTLFDHILPNAIFAEVLDAFYNSERDELTLKFISK